jgi:SOS response associated peptidase (SRAP)
MCGRYTLSRIEEILARFGIEPDGLELRPGYNVCPEQTMPVVLCDVRNHLELMKWGLIPFWSNEPKSLAFNLPEGARAGFLSSALKIGPRTPVPSKMGLLVHLRQRRWRLYLSEAGRMVSIEVFEMRQEGQ